MEELPIPDSGSPESQVGKIGELELAAVYCRDQQRQREEQRTGLGPTQGRPDLTERCNWHGMSRPSRVPLRSPSPGQSLRPSLVRSRLLNLVRNRIYSSGQSQNGTEESSDAQPETDLTVSDPLQLYLVPNSYLSTCSAKQYHCSVCACPHISHEMRNGKKL